MDIDALAFVLEQFEISSVVQSGVNQAFKLVGKQPAVGVPRVGVQFTCDGFYPHDQSIVAQFTAPAI
jgi:hypothetical protein